MKLKCPHCARSLNFKGKSRGQFLPCPACGGRVKLADSPGPHAAPSAASPTSVEVPAGDKWPPISPSPSLPTPVDVGVTTEIPASARTAVTRQLERTCNESSGAITHSHNTGQGTAHDSSAKRRGTIAITRRHGLLVAAAVLIAAALVPIYLRGFLIPILQFLLFAGLAVAVIGVLYVLTRILMLALVPTSGEQHKDDRALRSAGVACAFVALLCAFLMFLLAPMGRSHGNQPSSKDSSAIAGEVSPSMAGTPSAQQSAQASASTPQVAQAAPSSASVNIAPPRESPATPVPARRDSSEQGFAEFLGALVQANAQQQAAEQERQYQEFRKALQNASVCSRCGGAGTYRYVDAAGVLQAPSCPSCLGSGRSYGSAPLFGSPR
jgi:hypothetical protein